MSAYCARSRPLRAGASRVSWSLVAAAIAVQSVRAAPDTPAFYLGDRRSPLQAALAWRAVRR